MNRGEIDLHLHLDGSLSVEVVKTLVQQTGYDLKGRSVKELLTAGDECRNLPDYLKSFELPIALLQSESALELASYDLVKRLAAQGVFYGEIRFAPQIHRQKGLLQEQAVEAVLRGVQRGCRESGIYIGILLCALVNGEDTVNEETMELAKAYLGKGVVGADIAGAEGLVPMEYYKGLFQRIYRAGVPFTIHAGECGDYENIVRAVSYGAKRIGHGCAAVKSERCMELLIRENITLEMCVISNLQTKAVEGITAHPIKKFYDLGMRVTYNTDNMTVSNTGLEREADLLKSSLGFVEADLRKMNEFALEAAFAGEGIKAELRRRVFL